MHDAPSRTSRPCTQPPDNGTPRADSRRTDRIYEAGASRQVSSVVYGATLTGLPSDPSVKHGDLTRRFLQVGNNKNKNLIFITRSFHKNVQSAVYNLIKYKSLNIK